MNAQENVSAPTLSIVIPVHNGEKHLLDCLRSLGDQSFGYFEAIVVDDGSTDSSHDIAMAIARRDPRFTVISTPNGGVSRARNTGLRAARGTYVTFVDADDWVDRNMYEDLLRPTKTYCYDAVAGDLVIESARGKHRVEEAGVAGGAYDAGRIRREIWPIVVSSNHMTRDWPYRIVTKLFRRDHLRENDLWFVPGLAAAQDFVFSVAAMVKTDSLYYVKGSSGYHYRWNPNSRTRSRLSTGWANYRGVDQALRDAVPHRPPFIDQLLIAQLHGDLSALTYLYRNCRLRDSRVLYNNLTHNLAQVDRQLAFQALDWSRMAVGKRAICELMRLRRYRLLHGLLVARGCAQKVQNRLLQSRVA